jgi:hypothetical protein
VDVKTSSNLSDIEDQHTKCKSRSNIIKSQDLSMSISQDWFHLHKPSVAPQFHPYVPDADLPTTWYKKFENQGTAEHMWEMWFIYYMHIEQLFCVFSNLGVYTGNKESCMCINRREVGLHVSTKGPEDLCKLLTVWRDEFVATPEKVIRLHWDGEPMGNRHFFLQKK